MSSNKTIFDSLSSPSSQNRENVGSQLENNLSILSFTDCSEDSLYDEELDLDMQKITLPDLLEESCMLTNRSKIEFTFREKKYTARAAKDFTTSKALFITEAESLGSTNENSPVSHRQAGRMDFEKIGELV